MYETSYVHTCANVPISYSPDAASTSSAPASPARLVAKDDIASGTEVGVEVAEEAAAAAAAAAASFLVSLGDDSLRRKAPTYA